LKRNNLDPDRDVVLRTIRGTAVRAVALERDSSPPHPSLPKTP